MLLETLGWYFDVIKRPQVDRNPACWVRFWAKVVFARFRGYACFPNFATRVTAMTDPVEVDPKHYKVEFENGRVRVLRINYEPHGKSMMHQHPPGIAVILSDCDFRFYLPEHKTQEIIGKAGAIIAFEEAFE